MAIGVSYGLASLFVKNNLVISVRCLVITPTLWRGQPRHLRALPSYHPYLVISVPPSVLNPNPYPNPKPNPN